MAIDMTPEQRQVGEQNFKAATEQLGMNRRDFLKGGLLGVGAVAGSAAAVYFGYKSWEGRPVKAALIGTGDEGGVLVGEHNPAFLQFVAVCDVRPSNLTRIIDGDAKVALRKGFKKVYGIEEANGIKQYVDYKKMLAEVPEIEAVVIALPLHLHASVSIECMKAGKHVLCEKLMAWNVLQCKEMIRVAKETKRILSIGHQRHYSMLYAHASEVVKAKNTSGENFLGDIKHIRALWHRNFSWPYVHDEKAFRWAYDKPEERKQVAGIPEPKFRDGWFQPVLKGEQEELMSRARAEGMDLKALLKQYGYEGKTGDEALAQLVRWRLHAETGGGLMAELGSHQLDACSIFLGKVKPLSVQGVGVKSFFGPKRNDRNIHDHVFVTYEFPGKNHPKGPNKGSDRHDIVVVTYSSISTNGFEQYGEYLMGTRGSMVVEAEQRVMLYTEKDPTVKAAGTNRTMTANVSTLPKDAAAAEAMSTWGGVAAATPGGGPTAGAPSGPISRGYREEMEDFAYCIRLWNNELGYEKDEKGAYKQRLPRCHGEVAMADAIIALSSNYVMNPGTPDKPLPPTRIDFEKIDPTKKKELGALWFDADELEAVPDHPNEKRKA